jgi:hypothetical protein
MSGPPAGSPRMSGTNSGNRASGAPNQDLRRLSQGVDLEPTNVRQRTIGVISESVLDRILFID